MFSEYTYTLESIIQAGQKNLAITAVPVRVNRDLRPSKLVTGIPSYIGHSIVTIVRIFVIYRPSRFFGSIGTVFFAPGAVFGVRFLFEYVAGFGEGHVQSLIPASIFLGMDFRTNHPGYRFDTSMPFEQRGFDTIVSLAVIEHVADRVESIRGLELQLRNGPASRILLTTPHQSMEWMHAAGAKLGLFSRQANEEHEELLDERALRYLADQAECQLIRYKRFLFGAIIINL